MLPVQIKLSDSVLLIKWDDNHSGTASLHKLRDQCPCAGCRGETILLKTYLPELKPELPGKYEITGIQKVGNYAIQISWKDGHSTGIYTWQNLRDLCECAECTGKR